MIMQPVIRQEIGKEDVLSEGEVRERKRQVLNHGRASVTHPIADDVVIKSDSLFFLSQPDGSLPLSGRHGLGLYYHDCRFLNGYELWIGDVRSVGIDPQTYIRIKFYSFRLNRIDTTNLRRDFYALDLDNRWMAKCPHWGIHWPARAGRDRQHTPFGPP
jgi:hypothetical protein